jgi:hypothetical protein
MGGKRRWGRFVFGEEKLSLGRWMIGEDEGVDLEVCFEEDAAKRGDGLCVRNVGGLVKDEIGYISLASTRNKDRRMMLTRLLGVRKRGVGPASIDPLPYGAVGRDGLLASLTFCLPLKTLVYLRSGRGTSARASSRPKQIEGM